MIGAVTPLESVLGGLVTVGLLAAGAGIFGATWGDRAWPGATWRRELAASAGMAVLLFAFLATWGALDHYQLPWLANVMLGIYTGAALAFLVLLGIGWVCKLALGPGYRRQLAELSREDPDQFEEDYWHGMRRQVPLVVLFVAGTMLLWVLL